MASANQETVENSAADTNQTLKLTGIFGTSPVLTGDLTTAERRQVYVDLLNSTVQNGHGFSEGVDLNYAGSPDFSDVPEGAASAFLPNPTSPGEGNGANPNAKPDAPDAYKNAKSNAGTFPGGPAIAPDEVSPADVAEKISGTSLDGLVLGKSRWSAGS
jgi:hypothetical protein